MTTPNPSTTAKENMNLAADDCSHVFIQATGELWVVSVFSDPIHWTDKHGRGWHWMPDPRPPKTC